VFGTEQVAADQFAGKQQITSRITCRSAVSI